MKKITLLGALLVATTMQAQKNFLLVETMINA